MTAPGLKAQPQLGEPPRDAFCNNIRIAPRSLNPFPFEDESDRPPRLCRKDLKDPERFRRRLVDWLLRQR